MKDEKGFTLIEILVVIAILGLLAASTIIAVNPAKQFKQARNTQRSVNAMVILDAVGHNMAEHGNFLCSSGSIPTTPTKMASVGGYNIGNCVSPLYISSLPFDPSAEGAYWDNQYEFDTGYLISQEGGSGGRVTISAPLAEDGALIAVKR